MDTINPRHEKFVEENKHLVMNTLMLIGLDLLNGKVNPSANLAEDLTATVVSSFYAVLDEYDKQRTKLNAPYN